MSFIPFIHIKAVFDTQREKLEGIVHSLPSYPILIKTPSLLNIMTGKKWEGQMISHNLLKIWIATMFYIRSLERKGSISTRIENDLKAQQQQCFENETGNAFTIAYIHCYEYAIIKYLHLFKVGEEGAKSPDEGQTPSITGYILNIPRNVEELGLNTIITSGVLPEQDGSKVLQDFIVDYEKKRKQYGIEN